jgi:hypothetical protein
MHTTTTPRRTARLTGIAYLGIVVSGIFAEFFVRMSLVVPDDPVTTAGNIAGAPGLFGAGITADIVMVALDVAVAFGLYRLLRPVSRSLAIAATAFRLIQAVIIGSNLRNALGAWGFANEAVDTGSTTAAEQSLAAMETFAVTYDVALIFFGLACLALGRLLVLSRVVPKLLAVALYATGVVYLIGSLDVVLGLGLSSVIDPLYSVAIIAEPAFAIWLIAKGRALTVADVPAAPALTA